MSPAQIGEVARLAAIGAWRYSQGVYRVDPDLYAELSNSIVAGSLPSEVLHRLPEWCIYIEAEGRKWLDTPIHGYWVHLEWDANTQRTELRLLLDAEDDLIGVPLHLGDWTVTEAVDRAIDESMRQAQTIGLPLAVPAEAVQLLSEQINPLISIILYLCSEAPEIDNDLAPGISPAKPQPKKTKRGLPVSR